MVAGWGRETQRCWFKSGSVSQFYGGRGVMVTHEAVNLAIRVRFPAVTPIDALVVVASVGRAPVSQPGQSWVRVPPTKARKSPLSKC